MTGARARTTRGLAAVLALAAAMLVAGLSPRPSKAGLPPTTVFGWSVSDEDGGFYQIDLNTGVATLIGFPGFFNVEGLAFGLDEQAVVGLYGVDTDLDALVRIFPDGTGVEIGTIVDEFGTPIGTDDVGLTFFGTQLLMSNVDDDGLFTLYELIIPAGEVGDVTAIPIGFNGDLGQPVTGLTADLATVVGLGGADASLGDFPTNNFVLVDPVTGTAAEIGALGLPYDVIDGGIDIDFSTGLLWGINDGETDGESHLFTIDSATGAATDQFTVTDSDGNILLGFEGFEIAGLEDEPEPEPECSGEIQVRAKKLQFGDVRLKKSRLRSFNIKNVSKDEDLFIEFISVEFPFEVVNGTGPIVLGPGERRTVAVTFTPESRGKVRDTLTIFSSDCKAGDVTLTVVGKGVRRK